MEYSELLVTPAIVPSRSRHALSTPAAEPVSASRCSMWSAATYGYRAGSRASSTGRSPSRRAQEQNSRPDPVVLLSTSTSHAPVIRAPPWNPGP